MPPRRISAAKRQQFTTSVGRAEEVERKKALVTELLELIKSASEVQLLAVRSMLKGDSAAEPEVTLPRGVRFLGGSPPGAVPHYIIVQQLSRKLNIDKGALQ
eukprot:8203527-Lingulodinium_polyedra.AAC.1